MPDLSSQEYLLTQQYKNASNLQARIRFHRLFSVNKNDFTHWIFDQLHIPAQAHVLELGCGPGDLWRNNEARIPAGWHVTLSDFSPGMLAEARNNLKADNEQFSFALVDAQSIPFGDASFDAVIANYMLYHVPDRAKAIGEIRRVLKPDGHCYAATNGLHHLEELKLLARRFDPGVDGLWGEDLPLPFRLETGMAELSQYFTTVNVYRFENQLLVTEAGPLVDYMLSTLIGSLYTAEKVGQFRQFVKQELVTLGIMRVTVDTGLFESW